MLLGAGGSGTSSLLDGLMNIPFHPTDSTALVNPHTLSYQWVEAADSAKDAWKPHTVEDESKQLATRLSQVVESRKISINEREPYIGSWDSVTAVKIFDVAGGSLGFLKKVTSDSRYS